MNCTTLLRLELVKAVHLLQPKDIECHLEVPPEIPPRILPNSTFLCRDSTKYSSLADFSPPYFPQPSLALSVFQSPCDPQDSIDLNQNCLSRLASVCH